MSVGVERMSGQIHERVRNEMMSGRIHERVRNRF